MSVPAAPMMVPVDVPFDGENGYTVVVGHGGLPIPVKRFFWLGNVPATAMRADHAHRRCHQLFVSVEGEWEVTVEGADPDPVVWTLKSHKSALWVPPLNWVRVRQPRDWRGALLAVLASEPFNAADYYRDFEAWKREVRGGQA